MFLLPRKRRSTATTVEAATPNQRVRLTTAEASLTVTAASSTLDGVALLAGAAPPRESGAIAQASGDRTLLAPSWIRASGEAIVVDGKRLYPCRVCGFRFSASSNRSRHERNKHAEPARVQAIGVSELVHRADTEKETRLLDSSASQESPENTFVEDRHEMNTDQMDEMDESFDRRDASDSGTSSSEPIEVDNDTPSATDSGSEATSVSATALGHAPPYEPLGALALMQDTHLQSECLPFLRWMCTPPITQVEALVKARRVTSMTQLQPIKLNLRFIFGLLLEAKAIETLELQTLTRLAVCQALSAALEQRQVSHGRVHALFLLVKKILVHLSSQESTRRHQFLAPTMHESYLFVENVCSDSSHRRKQDARNRAVLGVQTSKTLQALNGNRSSHVASALSPEAFTMPSMLGPASNGATQTSVSPLRAPQHASSSSPPQSSSSSYATASTSDSEPPSPNELTCDELKIVAKGALAYLQQHRDTDSAAPAYYIHHLVTATLCLGLAPRSQVLKQLRIGSSFVKEPDGCYRVNMLAELNKNGKPTSFALPKALTEPFDYYLTTLRPRLLCERGQEHDYVFFKRNGTAPRTDFSDLTTVATQQLIQRPINPHAFRSAVITTFWETGASQSQMEVLATIMSHSFETARAFYFKPQLAKTSVDTSNRMLHALDLSADSLQQTQQ